MSIEGSGYRALSDSEKQEILDGYLSDGIITEKDLDNKFITDSLTGAYLESVKASLGEEGLQCGNCLGLDGEVEEEIQQEGLPLQQAQDYSELSQVFELETTEQTNTQESAQKNVGDSSPQLLRENIIGSDPVLMASLAESAIVSSPSSQRTTGSDYSTDLVVKNLQSVTIYDSYYQQQRTQVDFTYIKNYPESNSVLVKAYGMPSFYCAIKDARWENGKAYLTLKLPTFSDEPEQTMEVFYSNGVVVHSDRFVEIPTVSGFPSVSDQAALASLQSVSGYDAAHAQAYKNAYKLSPFASLEDIVKSGNAISSGSPLATKEISEIWPIHKEDGMKVSLLNGQEQDIVKNFVYFSDGTFQTYDLNFIGKANCTASYVMGESGILYQPNFWVIDENSKPGVERIANFIKSKTWNTYFKSFMGSTTMHRAVRDYFDNEIHEQADEIAANLVSNIPNWNALDSSSETWNRMMGYKENATSTSSTSSTVSDSMFNIMFLYTYYQRFFDFEIGGSKEAGFQNNANAFLVMAFRGGVISPGLSLLSLTPTITSSNMATYGKINKLSTDVFPRLFKPYSGISTVPQFIETLVSRASGYTDTADWFADYLPTFAFYQEYKPPVIEGYPETDQLTWRGWDQAKRYPDSLPLWLTMEPGAMYMASGPLMLSAGPTGVYEAKAELNDATREAYKARFDNIFPYAGQYASTVATILGKDRVNNIDVLVCDAPVSMYDTGKSQPVNFESQGLWGVTCTEDPYHKNYTDVTGYYLPSGQGAAAMTINQSLTSKRIHFLAYTALGCGWSYYWSHELAHAVDNDLFLGGDRRGKDNTEDYTDGLLTQSMGGISPVMNLSYNYEPSVDLITNFTQDRIYGKENLNDYYHKLYETMDTLDYAALKAFLRLGKDEQNAVASQVQFDGHNGNSPLDWGATATFLCSRKSVLDNYDGTVATMPVNSSVFNDGSKKFETFDEVYDNQIFLRPGISEEINTTWLWANYVTEDQRGMWWFPVHCNGNRPDSRSFKVEMYRMLGREGYDAFAEFSRHGGGGDLYKLQTITGYSSFKEWQKAAYDAIEAKKDSLEYVGFDDLVNKFEAVLRTDAANHDRNLNSSHSLRMRMLYMMKRVTDDFRSGIFEKQRSVTHIRTLSDLQSVSNNPYGCYVLDNDIDASSADTGDAGALISGVFYGKFDGQGHRILSKGRILPNVFQGLKHAYVKDLALEGVGAETLAAAINNCEIENISYKKLVREIRTVDDLVGMNDDLKAGVNEFNLMADLDFTEWSTANAAADTKKLSVVTQLMAGTKDAPKKFNGNGHTITGLSGASLFDKVCYAEIRDLSIKNSSNMQDATSGDNVSLVARRSAKSVFSDLYLDTVSAQGRYRVGFIVGDDGGINQSGAEGRVGGSRFERIQVTNGRLWNGNSSVQGKCCYAGFIAGRVTNSDLTDIFVQGVMALYGVSSGGVVGAITCSARMDRCVSKVNVSATVANGKNGVVFGDIEDAANNAYDADNTRISACFGLGSPTNTNAARLGRMTAQAQAAFVNCYENVSNTEGQTLVGASVPGVTYARTDLERLGHISKDLQNACYTFPMLCRNSELYKSLGFDPNVWDIEPTIEAGYPMLRYVGDKAAFSQYDMDIKIDYKNEKLVCSGSSFDLTKRICLHNLPYRAIMGTNVGEWEAIDYKSVPIPFMWMTANPDSVNLSEIIEYEGFGNAETDLKGTRTVSLYLKAYSGKSYSYVKSVELSPRQENPYMGVIRGIRADADGTGSIHALTVGCDAMPAIEYRPVAQVNDGAEGEDSASENAAEWIPITSSSTRVPAGTYEVRASATDSSFASYPSTIVVGEYEPEATSFPLVLDPNGGTLDEAHAAIENYDSANKLALPGAAELTRPGYTFEGWFAKDGSGSFTGEAVREIAAGGTSAVVLYAKWTKASSSTDENTGGSTDENTGGSTGGGQGGAVAPAPKGPPAPVIAPTMTVYAANVSTGKLTLANGKSFSLKGAAVVKRKGTVAATGKVRYKSSNPKVVTVSASGKVKASKKRTGRAKITITSVDNPANKKVVTVTVVKKAKYKAAKKIMKTSLKASYKANAKKAYSVSVKKWSPASPSNKNIVVSVSPKSRASVNPATGKITFKKKGTVKVTVRSATDPRAKIVVKVKVK